MNFLVILSWGKTCKLSIIQLSNSSFNDQCKSQKLKPKASYFISIFPPAFTAIRVSRSEGLGCFSNTSCIVCGRAHISLGTIVTDSLMQKLRSIDPIGGYRIKTKNLGIGTGIKERYIRVFDI